MKDIKDYLPLYFGCEVRITGINQTQFVEVNPFTLLDFTGSEFKIELILRPLSDMTEEEAKYVKRVLHDNHGIDTIKTVLQRGWHLGHVGANASQMFQITRHLLSKGFDLFGLVEAGLAIDKTTNQN